MVRDVGLLASFLQQRINLSRNGIRIWLLLERELLLEQVSLGLLWIDILLHRFNWQRLFLNYNRWIWELSIFLQGISPFEIAANLVQEGPLLWLEVFVVSLVLQVFFCLHEIALDLNIGQVNINGSMSPDVWANTAVLCAWICNIV